MSDERARAEVAVLLLGQEVGRRGRATNGRVDGAQAAVHVLAREVGRRSRALHVRVDEAEASRSTGDGDLREALASGLWDLARGAEATTEVIGGLIGEARAEASGADAVATARLDALEPRVDAVEVTVSAVRDEVGELDDRVGVAERLARVPGPPGPKGEAGPAGKAGPAGRAMYVSGGGGSGGGTATEVLAGTGIGVAGTTSVTVSNTGVTSLVAGTNVTVSGATGAVTVNATGEPLSYGTPGASAIGDAVGAGSATTVSRSDHAHGRESAGVPIAVTAGATGSAGSATTVARSDHAHATAGVAVLFARTTLASAAASITFASIPAGYKHYEMRFGLRSDRASATDNVMTRLNGDSAANYRQGGVAFTYMVNATISGGTSLGLLAHYYSVPLLFAGDSTNYTASGYCLGSYSHATSYQTNVSAAPFVWLNTACVTSITLSSFNGANFVSGSCAELWGVP